MSKNEHCSAPTYSAGQTPAPGVHVVYPFEYHVDEVGWTKVYDLEYGEGSWFDKGPWHEVIPAEDLNTIYASS